MAGTIATAIIAAIPSVTAGSTAAAVITVAVNLVVGVATAAASAAIAGAFSGGGTLVGPRLADTKVTVSTWGNGIGIVHGAMRTSGNVINMLEEGIRETSQEEGGKGGGSSQTTYKYYGTFEVGLCESSVDDPISSVVAVWANSKLIYDIRAGTLIHKRFRKTTITPRTGVETQQPHPRWEEEWGAGEVPAGRGVCSILIEDLPLIDFGNRIPNITAIVSRNASELEDDFIDWDTTGAPDMIFDSYRIDRDRGTLISASADSGQYFSRYDPVEGKFITDSLKYKDQRYAPNEINVDIDPETGKIYSFGDPDSTAAVGGGYAIRTNPTTLVEEAIGDYEMHNGTNGTYVNGSRVHFIEGGVTGNGRIYTMQKDSLGFAWVRDPVVDWGFGRIRTATVDNEGTLWAASSVTADSEFRLYKIGAGGYLNKTFDFETEMTGGAGPDILLQLGYDEPRHSLILIASGNMASFDIESETLSAVGTVGMPPLHDSSVRMGFSKSGRFWVESSSQVFTEIDVSLDPPAVVQSVDISSRGNAAAGYVNVIYDEDRSMLICNASTTGAAQFQFLPIERQSTDATTLDVIVADICEHAGFAPEDIDVTDLAAISVRGFVIGKAESARRILESLVPVFFFDAYNGDGKLKFIARGRAVDHTLDQENLAAREPSDNLPAILSKGRGQESEIPRRVNFKYFDVDEDYEEGLQTDTGEQALSVAEVTFEVPVSLTADEARSIAVRIHREIRVSRDEFTLTTAARHWDIDPTDVLQIEEIG